jgi:hypothetical protein
MNFTLSQNPAGQYSANPVLSPLLPPTIKGFPSVRDSPYPLAYLGSQWRFGLEMAFISVKT